jgi:hypothetical protein
MAEFTPVPVEPGAPRPGGSPTSADRPGRRAGLLRWGVALTVTVLVAGTASAGAILLASGATTSAIEGWIPSGTVAYLEARADLPGDQRQNVGNILATFPGFRDQSSLDAKINQALDQALQKTGISWTADLEPWVAGEVGVAVTRDLLDAAAAARTDPASAAPPDQGYVVLASVKDVVAATAWIAREVGGTPSTAAYGDGSITTVTRDGLNIAWVPRRRSRPRSTRTARARSLLRARLSRQRARLPAPTSGSATSTPGRSSTRFSRCRAARETSPRPA